MYKLLLKYNTVDKLIVILFFLALIPLLILSFYTEPSSDDYSYAVKILTDKFINIQIHEYMHWGSRYTATAILITNFYWGADIGYKVMSSCMIVFFVLASFFIFFQLTRNRSISFVLSSFFCFTYFFLLPDLNSAFYWLAGSATYHLANILFLLFIV